MEAYTDDSESGTEDCGVNVQKLCRLCAIHDSCLIPLNERTGKKWDLVMKIKKHLLIEIPDDINMPNSICCTCASTLSSWHSFYIKFIKAQKRLKKLIHIAMDNMMSTKENHHERDLQTQKSGRKNENYVNRSGSKQISNKCIALEKGRNLSGSQTEMISQSTLQASDNEDVVIIQHITAHSLDAKKIPGSQFSETTKCTTCLKKCDNNFDSPRKEETKNFESDNLYILSEKNVCFGTTGKMLKFVCGHCSKTFPEWRSLDIHLKVRHKYKTFSRKSYSQCIPKDSYVRVFYCKVCDRSFLHTEKDFMIHMKNHETSVPALADHDYW